MPSLTHSATLDVRAPADVAFAVIARDMVKADDDPDAMTGHRPLDDGPLREGFRWRQRVIHNRKECSTDGSSPSWSRPLACPDHAPLLR